MLNCTCRFLVDHLTGPSGPGDMEKGRFLCQRMWCVFPTSNQDHCKNIWVMCHRYPTQPVKLSIPFGLTTLVTPYPFHWTPALTTPKFQFLFISNSTYPSWIRVSHKFLAHTRPPILFDPKTCLEHHLTLSLLGFSNLLLQTSFPLNFPALPSQSASATAIPHHSMVRNHKRWSPGSDGCSAPHLWTPHLCLNHLPTSTPTTMNFHGTLSPSSSTAPLPLLHPQREWPNSCILQGESKYRLQFPEIYFKRMQRIKSKIYFRKTRCI